VTYATIRNNGITIIRLSVKMFKKMYKACILIYKLVLISMDPDFIPVKVSWQKVEG